MKKLIVLIFLAFGYSSYAQDASGEQDVKEVIETFFEGFHARDVE